MAFTGQIQKKSYRLQYRFWLDAAKSDEYQLAEYAEEMKVRRTFAQTIRDGLSLMRDLRNGRVDMLLLLFPWVEEYFTRKIADSIKLELPIQKQLETITTLLLQQPAEVERKSPAQLSPPLPSIEKEPEAKLEVTEARSNDNNRPNWNFLISSALNVYGNCNNLPDEVIAYGLRTSRISPGMLTKKPVEKGPKAMNVPQFEAPAFDDLNLAPDSG